MAEPENDKIALLITSLSGILVEVQHVDAII
jgi:hypothetical protein